MRISDWSSEVCSSDLVTPKQAEMLSVVREIGSLSISLRSLAKNEEELERLANQDEPLKEADPVRGDTHTWDSEVSRSEEHTSELQSLMRISYAVFCLKKKKQQN